MIDEHDTKTLPLSEIRPMGKLFSPAEASRIARAASGRSLAKPGRSLASVDEYEKFPPLTKRGGRRAGSGRKALDPDGSCVTSIRLTAEQRATFEMLGGSAWLREALQTLITPS